ncbi:thiazole/oxazole-forming peptide maturase SagD family component [Amycolatopsis lexingtonensis]|uniref:Thiazole/oxazole-forming peptide maturase SagD family component n=1 Tax=Amycolatopsis lexingtonensis TaxID=218822 RepID=A0ABR9HQD5_9PSEU|nr:YcaO-like family protein [Amycolatopsis lexingtonensis]MBE1493143.1 thiazole/oxazole-forming peptide maturase SagD family component [Amycolatopsis lexingtonensis]
MPETRTESGLRLVEPPDAQTARLRARMHSPLCGLMPQLGFLARAPLAPRMIVSGGDLTGVHVLRDQPKPQLGSYHIGGYGVRPFESYIRTLGEVCERYAGFVAPVSGRHPVRFCTAADLGGEPHFPVETHRLYTAEQFASGAFPFSPADRSSPLGWSRMVDLRTGADTWVPAQLTTVGYVVRDVEGERWLQPAVTTGTAAHTDPDRAALGSLQEMAQIDAAIGHWYGRTRSVRLRRDTRTAALWRLVGRHCHPLGGQPEFHLLPSPDLPGFTIACLLREPERRLPAVVVGLGVDGALEPAMYKAFLEAAGVRALATWAAVRDGVDGRAAAEDGIFDLESNVVLAATPRGSEAVEARYGDSDEAAPGDLPPDAEASPGEQARALVSAFHATGKRLFAADLTTTDIACLGFVVSRFWSPDLLTLPLPSAPAAAHPRFAAYRGFARHDPHPFP